MEEKLNKYKRGTSMIDIKKIKKPRKSKLITQK